MKAPTEDAAADTPASEPSGRPGARSGPLFGGQTVYLTGPELARARRRRVRGWAGWLMIGGAVVAVLIAMVVGWPGPVEAPDVEQPRLDVALPLPRPHSPLRQTFRPRNNGLVAVELLLARTAPEDPARPGRLTLTLADEAGRIVAEQQLTTTSLAHNQLYLWRFAPQWRSAGRDFTLMLTGNESNPMTVWGYSLDVLTDGALEPAGEAQELRFSTRYRLGIATVADALIRGGRQSLGLVGLSLLLLVGPGWLILEAWRLWRCRRGRDEYRGLPGDGPALWGLILALGFAAWPPGWLWLSLAGGRWAGWSVAAMTGASWLGGFLLARRRWRRVPRSPLRLWRRQHAWLLLILLASWGARLVTVRDETFPLWVDASRHALITAVMRDQGRMPGDYAPYLPVDQPGYHYGFHTLAAGLQLLSEQDLASSLLFLGQWLNALMPLMVYAGAWLLTRRRTMGLVAAFLVALPFFFPAYYATWGRFTQLTGLLLLPLLLALTWRLSGGGHETRYCWPLVSLLAAGLFLIHVRVFLLYLPFTALAWLVNRGRGSRGLALGAIGALALVGPRLALLWRLAAPVVGQSIPGYNAFPVAYLRVGWERPFLVLAGLGLLWSGWMALKRRRPTLPLVLFGWIGLLVVLLSGARLGLPESWLINLNSLYISLFVPLAWLLGWGMERLGRLARPWPWVVLLVAYPLLGGGVALAALFGGHQQAGILNQATRLAWPADRPALAWAATHLPVDAVVAVNAWNWLGETWAGSDGGAWLLPLTGRTVTTPPVDYIYSPALSEAVRQFNEGAMAIDDWSTPAAAAWLWDQGVSHVFVGARGGFFDPAELSRNEAATLLYSQDGAFVFDLR